MEIGYRISANSFRGNYSFLKLALCTVATVHKSAETIKGRKLFKGGNYLQKYGMTTLFKCNDHCGQLVHTMSTYAINKCCTESFEFRYFPMQYGKTLK